MFLQDRANTQKRRFRLEKFLARIRVILLIGNNDLVDKADSCSSLKNSISDLAADILVLVDQSYRFHS